jgi:hypothetical protein
VYFDGISVTYSSTSSVSLHPHSVKQPTSVILCTHLSIGLQPNQVATAMGTSLGARNMVGSRSRIGHVDAEPETWPKDSIRCKAPEYGAQCLENNKQ